MLISRHSAFALYCLVMGVCVRSSNAVADPWNRTRKTNSNFEKMSRAMTKRWWRTRPTRCGIFDVWTWCGDAICRYVRVLSYCRIVIFVITSKEKKPIVTLWFIKQIINYFYQLYDFTKNAINVPAFDLSVSAKVINFSRADP